MRKNATKIAALALSLALTVTSVNIPTNASAASVKLNKKKATLYVSGAKTKKTTTLKVTGTKKKVTFTSNKKAVATVNKKGKVTAKKAGKATITAKVGKKSYKCTITVKKTYKPVTSLTVSPKTVTLNVGKTKKITATVKPAKVTQKGVTYKSNKTSVATVSAAGKITAKKAGTAKITVTTKGATKTKSNKKATVAVTVKKAASTPTDAPSTSPSDTPSDAPSTNPSDTPSDAPTDAPTTLGKITELKATKATQLTATFDSAVPADTKIAVTKATSEIKGESKIDGSTVVFDAAANLAAGTYTLTATLGETKVSADVEVKDSHVAEIKIIGKEALTGEKKINTASEGAITVKEAYIYYDVLNQYGESIRNSTTIDWTTSVGNESKKIDKSLGKITVQGEQAALNYGSLIYVTGVHTASGTVVNTSIPVGMSQEVDTIEFAGFINKDDRTKLVDSLPVNFPNNKYLLAYRTFDQNGNPLEVTGKEVTESKLTFMSDNVLLIDPSSFKDNAEYAGLCTVDGTEYSTVTINPGEQAGKGGEVNITAIANKTGQKTVKNYTVGSAGLLQSLSLDTPADVVADGDQWVKIPYTAKDTDGKNITNYETIVRSSNALNLTASEGTLCIMEENDGTAGIYWSDVDGKATDFGSTATDNVDRSITLGTLVIGGDSNMMILPVSDARRPVAVKSIELYDAYGNAIADALADKGEADIRLIAPWDTTGVVYLDQYGKELKNGKHKEILAAYFGKEVKGYYHGIKVKSDSNGSNLQLTGADSETVAKAASANGLEKVFTYNKNGSPTDFSNAFQIKLTADMGMQAKVAGITNEVNGDDSIAAGEKQKKIRDRIKAQITELSTTLKFSIVECAANKGQTDVNNWDNVDKEKNVVYKVVPVHCLSGYSITKLGKQEIETDLSKYANFVSGQSAASSTSGAAITDEAEGTLAVVEGKINPAKDAQINAFSVTGKTKDGKTVIIPVSYYKDNVTSGSAFTIAVESGLGKGAVLEKVKPGILDWSDLYDENTAKGTRRDSIKKLELCIKAPGLSEEGEPVSQKVTISDGMGVPSEIRFYMNNWSYDAKDMTFLAKNTVIERDTAYDGNSKYLYGPDGSRLTISQYGKFQVHVLDQYGKAATVKNRNGEELEGLTEGRDLGDYIEYTVSDIKENTGDFAHLANSFKVEQNGSTYNKLKITGAELGDKYTLTASIPGTSISKSIAITVGADTQAHIAKSSIAGQDSAADEEFRKDTLGYKK